MKQEQNAIAPADLDAETAAAAAEDVILDAAAVGAAAVGAAAVVLVVVVAAAAGIAACACRRSLLEPCRTQEDARAATEQHPWWATNSTVQASEVALPRRHGQG